MVKYGYDFKFMDEKQIETMNELLKGEHKDTLVAWGFECGNAAVAGFKAGIAENALLVGLGVGIAAVAFVIGTKLGKKPKEIEAEPVKAEVVFE